MAMQIRASRNRGDAPRERPRLPVYHGQGGLRPAIADSRRLELAGNDIPDAWIAAAAREHRMPVVPLDRGFTRLLPGDSLILLEP